MARQVFDVEIRTTVRVEVNDPDVFERVTGPGGDEWRRRLYPSVKTRDDVLKMFADTCVRWGIKSASRLDGWANLPPDAATMRRPEFAELEEVREVGGT